MPVFAIYLAKRDYILLILPSLRNCYNTCTAIRKSQDRMPETRRLKCREGTVDCLVMPASVTARLAS